MVINMTENKRFRIYQDLYEDFYIEDIESYYNQKLQRCYKIGNEEDIKYENVELLVNLLNEQSDKITEQGIQIDFLKDENKHMRQVLKENRQLKQQLEKYNNWCNFVKRENIDKVLKMSVFEIIEAFEYYDEKIKDYERILNGDIK